MGSGSQSQKKLSFRRTSDTWCIGDLSMGNELILGSSPPVCGEAHRLKGAAHERVFSMFLPIAALSALFVFMFSDVSGRVAHPVDDFVTMYQSITTFGGIAGLGMETRLC